jgi:predicted amidohydrolase YtcJ
VPRPFHDHHVHFLATVAASRSVDVSAAGSVGDVLARLAAEPGHGWLRAWGYDEAFLAERRHPTGDELDRACPDRPVVLHHRTGHGAVLNAAARTEVGAPDGDGLLVDRHDLLARVPRLPRGELDEGAAAVSREWAARGVGGFTDATHTNDVGVIETLARWRAAGVVDQEVTVMLGVDHLAGAPGCGTAVDGIRVGPAKVMPGPDADRSVAGAVATAREAGFPVAVHVMDVDVLEAVLGALEQSPPPAGHRDRIEHNALCLPEQVPRLAATGATVVVNPSFLLHRGRKYREQLAPQEWEWLVRIGSLVAAGVEVRAGSDSPVVPSDPAEMIAASTAHPFAPAESVSPEIAAALCAPPP